MRRGYEHLASLLRFGVGVHTLIFGQCEGYEQQFRMLIFTERVIPSFQTRFCVTILNHEPLFVAA